MKFFNVLLLGIVLLITSCSSEPNPQNTDSQVMNVSNKVEVIDFYGTHRCVTCKAIEANAKYTVNTFFPEEVKAGKVVFKTILVDDEANYDIAERFEATGTALFLNVIQNGKETHIDLTDFGFLKGKDKEAFSNELKTKIATELKKI
ncbi:MAG TPA: hypothetical protein ENJ82_12110 [Bacteroidetes bacterium]|nr:hypothetical protein [Bacteroidota bacterium]